METILVLAHTEPDGTVGRPALEALAAASALAADLGNAPVVVGFVGLGGADVQKAADSIAGCGAARFFGVAGAEFGVARYATDAAAAEAIARAAQATLVIAPATSRWCRTLAGAAARLGGRADNHVTAITVEGGAVAATRWYYRQRMEAVLKRTHRPWIILVDPGCRAPMAPAPGSARVEIVPVELSPTAKRTSVVGIETPAADQQTIRPDADLLLVAGAGWCKSQPDGRTHIEEAGKLIQDFLRLSQASLGGSKSLVDQSVEGQAVLSFMTHMNQVGQTGATPRHRKGLATCCHGEEPHVVGWRFITERRAVNLNAACGWAQGKADVLYVADAFAVMAKLNALMAVKGGK